MTTRQPFAVIWMALLLSASALAWANEADQAAPLVATPREAEMMDKGYLYYPPRAVRKPGVAKTPEPQALETSRADAGYHICNYGGFRQAILPASRRYPDAFV